MNKRIAELLWQCAIPADQVEDYIKSNSMVSPDQKLDVVKFAELIIFECTKVAIFKDNGYMHPADVAGHIAAGRSIAARMIREHFGVEE